MDYSDRFPPFPELPAETAAVALGQSPPATLHELLARVDHFPGITEKLRGLMRSAIPACARAAATAEASRGKGTFSLVTDSQYALRQALCDVGWLNERLYSVPTPALDLAEGTFQNYKWACRKAMDLAGITVYGDDHRLVPDGAWARLLAQLKEATRWRYGLIRFAVYCEARGIAPERVTDETLADFDRFVRHNILGGSSTTLAATAAKAWRRARRVLPSWPVLAVRSPPRRKPYTLPFTAYPMSLQVEIEALRAHLSDLGRKGPFTRKRGHRPLKPFILKPAEVDFIVVSCLAGILLFVRL